MINSASYRKQSKQMLQGGAVLELTVNNKDSVAVDQRIELLIGVDYHNFRHDSSGFL